MSKLLKAEPGKLVGVSRAELVAALQHSVGLQTHYAKLLNEYDGGQRREFRTVADWIERLREIGS